MKKFLAEKEKDRDELLKKKQMRDHEAKKRQIAEYKRKKLEAVDMLANADLGDYDDDDFDPRSSVGNGFDMTGGSDLVAYGNASGKMSKYK